MTKLEERVLIAVLLCVAAFFALRDASAAAGVAACAERPPVVTLPVIVAGAD